MNRFVLALALLLSSGAANASDPPIRERFKGDAAAAQAVWNTFEKWQAAYAAGELRGTMAIFERDVVFVFQGQKDESYADLEADYRKDFAARKPGVGEEWAPTVEEIFADGKIAFVRSIWEAHVHTADGVKVTARNRSIDVFRLGADQEWRIFRSLNYPEKRT